MNKTTTVYIIAILTAAVLLTGCGSGEVQSAKQETDPEPGTSVNMENGTVAIIRLEDGTKCAVYRDKRGYGGMGGLSCDWNNAK